MLSRNPFSFPQPSVFPLSHPLFHFGHAVSEALLKPLAAVFMRLLLLLLPTMICHKLVTIYLCVQLDAH